MASGPVFLPNKYGINPFKRTVKIPVNLRFHHSALCLITFFTTLFLAHFFALFCVFFSQYPNVEHYSVHIEEVHAQGADYRDQDSIQYKRKIRTVSLKATLQKMHHENWSVLCVVVTGVFKKLSKESLKFRPE